MDYRQLKTTNARRPLPRIALAAAALLAAVAAGPTSAHAGAVIEKDVAGPFGTLHVLQFGALSGENNDLLAAAQQGGKIRFEDSTQISSFPAGICQAVPALDPTRPGGVSCDATGVDQIRVLAGNGENEVHIVGPHPAYMTGIGAIHNRFYGGDGSDFLAGDVNSDILKGGGGGDRLAGGPGPDQLHGVAGKDILLGENGDDTLDGGADADVMRGGQGADFATYSSRPDAVKVSLDDAKNDGKDGEGDNVHTDIENVTGGFGDDILAGSAVLNRLYGEGGNDTIDAASGGDDLYGGQGDDSLSGDGGDDRLYGEVGNDKLDGGADNDILDGREGDDVMRGGQGADFIVGGDGVDRVSYTGSAGPVTADLDTEKGDDGAAGEQDSIMPSVEQLNGSKFGDTLTGNAEVNVLWGGGGDDRVDGGPNSDQLLGGTDDDTLLSADGVADDVRCGEGRDAIEADAVDTLDDCETGAPQAGDGPASAGAALRIGPARVRLTRRGVARLRIVCPIGIGDRCGGTVRMRRKIGGRLRTIGSRRFSVAAGRRATVRLRVAGVVRMQLSDAGLRVRVVARVGDAASAIRPGSRLIRILPPKGA